MIDPKMVVGTVLTVSATAATWIEQANAYGQFALTLGGIVVALLTAWYTIVRIKALRKDGDK